MEVGRSSGTAPGPAPVAPPAGARQRIGWRSARSLTVPLTLLLVLRLPSLFEPHWYTDEAGYATTAWWMSHGKILFLTTWNNKPPLLFWIYQLGLGLFGPTELGIHLLSTLTEAAAVVGTWCLARSYLSSGRVWVATLLTAVFLAIPVLNGDLALPENLLIGFTVWGMVAGLAAIRSPKRGRSLGLAAVAGVLFAGAILIQQTALVDLGVAMLVMLLAHRRGWLTALVAAGAAGVVVVLVMTPFVAAAGLHNVIFFLITSYAGYTQTTLSPSLANLGPRALLGLLLLAGAYAARKWPAEALLPWLWLPALMLAYVIPNRPYLHFLLAAVPAAALLLARLRPPHWRQWRSRAGLAGAPLLGSILLASVVWSSLIWSGFSGGSLFTVKLSWEYYPAFVGRLTGSLSGAAYTSIYDQRAIAEHDAVVWIRDNHLTGSTAVVWSPDAWAYLLGGLQPVLPEPTIYENFLLLGTKSLLIRVRDLHPVVVLLTSDSYTEFGPILPLLQRGYTEVQATAVGQLWIRSDVATRVLAGHPAFAGSARAG